MELDTGASVSIISENTYHATWSAANCPLLQASDAHSYMYSGELIEVLGSISVSKCYKTQCRHLSLLVAPTYGPVLFSCDWLNAIMLDWKQLHHIHSICHKALQDVLDQYSSLFKEGIGTLQGVTVKIHIQPDSHPCFFRPRVVHYSVRNKVNTETQAPAKGWCDWTSAVLPMSSANHSWFEKWWFPMHLRWL